MQVKPYLESWREPHNRLWQAFWPLAVMNPTYSMSTFQSFCCQCREASGQYLWYKLEDLLLGSLFHSPWPPSEFKLGRVCVRETSIFQVSKKEEIEPLPQSATVFQLTAENKFRDCQCVCFRYVINSHAITAWLQCIWRVLIVYKV